MKFVLIPVKQFSRAKERLAGLLSPEERRRLALAMYQDVLGAVTAAQRLDKVVIISNDPVALEMAVAKGVTILEEREQNGQSTSVDYAAKICMAMGATSLLSLPIDVPLIAANDVDYVLETNVGPPSVVLTPSWSERGTNALLRTPPDIIRSQFGSDSFREHTKQAQEKGVPYRVCRIPRIALDIDTPEDLARFAAHASTTKAYRELIKMGALKKIYEPEKQ